MRAVVLVGGEGTRLRPLTYETPKQMLAIAGVPMLERVLAQLARHGIDEAVLSLGYLPDAFTRAYPDGVAVGVRLHYAVEPEPLDTAGAVAFAARAAGINETFVVVNGDVLTDLNIGALIEFHQSRNAEGTIALHPVADPSAFGVVPTDDQGRVIAFVEKPAPGTAPTNLINAGTYILEPSFIERVDPDRRVSIEREVFPAMVADGGLFALADDSYWLDTGTPQALLRATHDFLAGHRGDPPAPGAIDHGGRVFVVDNAIIDGTVKGPSLLLQGAHICEGATVSDSVIGAHCVIGEGAIVDHSILLDGVNVEAGAQIRDSIVGAGARIGEGAQLLDASVVGKDAQVPAGETVSAGRIPS